MTSHKLKLLLCFVGAFLLGNGISSALAADGVRPQNDTLLLLRLNGVPTRPVLADGGGLGIYVTDGGTGCAAANGGSTYAWRCDVAANICITGGPLEMADGGACSNTIAAPNYGWPQDVGTTLWMVMQSQSQFICGHPQSGATLNCAVFLMQ